ncbi:MAG TPA: hypothetical protein VGO47_13500, partial [Chlamydiales bacterium]|nr:hypothetical protein [Chlamydiales bacterium]
ILKLLSKTRRLQLSGILEIPHNELNNSDFLMEKVISQYPDWNDKILLPDSPDRQNAKEMIQNLFYKWVESFTSTMASIWHSLRFRVTFENNEYTVEDLICPHIMFRIKREELYNELVPEQVLTRPVIESELNLTINLNHSAEEDKERQ